MSCCANALTCRSVVCLLVLLLLFWPVLQIHWFSIINSCVTVLLLTGFLTTILLRVLKNDFLKYTSRDDELGEAEDETGWKYLHGDVFRWVDDSCRYHISRLMQCSGTYATWVVC